MKGLLPVLLVLFLSGCASISDSLKSKHEGTPMVYPVNFDTAWTISLTVLRWEDAETIEERKDQNYMVTTVGASLWSMGSVIAVWVEPEGIRSTRVTIVSKRKMSTDLISGLSESTFHQRFAQALDILKDGGKLPRTRPN